jgi:hypothetical protein
MKQERPCDNKPHPLTSGPERRSGAEVTMGKVAAYHTDSQEGAKRDVHHDHDDCYEGKKIEPKHRKSGTGNKRLCEVCKKLG